MKQPLGDLVLEHGAKPPGLGKPLLREMRIERALGGIFPARIHYIDPSRVTNYPDALFHNALLALKER